MMAHRMYEVELERMAPILVRVCLKFCRTNPPFVDLEFYHKIFMGKYYVVNQQKETP